MPPEAPGQDTDSIPPETTYTSEWRVCCDGSGPGLGHPRVWLSIPPETGFVECGYCDRKFVHQSFADKVRT